MGSNAVKYVPPTDNVVVGQVGKSSIGRVVESQSSAGNAKLSNHTCVGR